MVSYILQTYIPDLKECYGRFPVQAVGYGRIAHGDNVCFVFTASVDRGEIPADGVRGVKERFRLAGVLFEALPFKAPNGYVHHTLAMPISSIRLAEQTLTHPRDPKLISEELLRHLKRWAARGETVVEAPRPNAPLASTSTSKLPPAMQAYAERMQGLAVPPLAGEGLNDTLSG